MFLLVNQGYQRIRNGTWVHFFSNTKLKVSVFSIFVNDFQNQNLEMRVC